MQNVITWERTIIAFAGNIFAWERNSIAFEHNNIYNSRRAP